MGHTWLEATCTEAKTCEACGQIRGNALGHTWNDATCTESEVCSVCGKQQGEPLGHKWEDATCTEAKTCSICDKTEGDPLGHAVEEWTLITDSTCTETGLESGVCAVCGEPIEQATKKKEHTPGEWEITKMPTEDEPGTRVSCCTVCGNQTAEEEFSLSEEELMAAYKEECQSIAYNDLARTPGEYEGELVYFYGKIVQVCSEASSPFFYSSYRLATYDGYDNVVYLLIDNYGTGVRILEDDWISVYGEFTGLRSYETVRGDTITIPEVEVKYYE